MGIKFETYATDSTTGEGPWADLPAELLEHIVHYLTLSDRLCFARVCKNWFLVIRPITPENDLSYGLPCRVSISNDHMACTLVDPFCNEIYRKCPNLPSQCNIIFSKGAWMLVLVGYGPSIFFFNPLTPTRIDLPDINFCHAHAIFAFSSPPTSPDCMVIAYQTYFDCYIKIFLCRRGQKNWTSLGEIETEFPFTSRYVSPVFYQGSFYCLDDTARLAIFDTNSNTFNVMPNPKSRQDLDSKRLQLYMAEFDGELYMVSLDKFGKSVQLCKLDPMTCQWIDIDNMGDKSLFVGRCSSICAKVGALEGNRIYIPRIKGGIHMFYSCRERTFHPSGDFRGSKVFPSSHWIEPVWLKVSTKKLKWSD